MVEAVEKVVLPVIEERGMELVDVEFLHEHGRSILRIYLDREGGVTLDDCADVSREVGRLMDVEEVIPHRYFLEVSSPGVNRVLKKEKDFHRFCGRRIEVKTLEAIGGRKKFRGTLAGLSDNVIRVETVQGMVELPAQLIDKAHLVAEN